MNIVIDPKEVPTILRYQKEQGTLTPDLYTMLWAYQNGFNMLQLQDLRVIAVEHPCSDSNCYGYVMHHNSAEYLAQDVRFMR